MRPKTEGQKAIGQRKIPYQAQVERKTLSNEEGIRSWLHSSRIPSEVREKIYKFASSLLPVFIQGEEGTGRDEVARALYLLGPWKDEPFLHYSCRQLTPEKFTERVSLWLKGQSPRKKVSLTLYLEELENLDGDIQIFLLDLIRNQQIYWPGLEGLSFNVRAISSSTSSLAETVSGKRFRSDLFETLEVLTIALKPLRERREDIPRLAREILQGKRLDKSFRKEFSPEALQILQQYDWPGNLPELESLILRSAALKDGDSLQPEDLIFHHPNGPSRLPSTQTEEEQSWFDVTLPTLAHEIKNPLVAISTFAHLLPEKYGDPEFRQEFSHLVNQDVRRINGLLENLLEFTQFSIPRSTPNDLNFVLEEILKQQQKVLHGRMEQITTELEEGLPPVFFDTGQLSFVLRKLLENALSRVNQTGLLHFATGSSRKEGPAGHQDFVDLKIWYDGQDGFPGTIWRSEWSGASPDFQNLSLALLLIRKVMARNGGKVRVWQEREARMTIWLRFPIAK